MRSASQYFALFGLLSIAAAPAAGGQPPAGQALPAATTDAHADDVVVIARRTGIPVWRVRGPTTTIVLVGSIGAVSPGTRWDPGALDAALAQADRVMFPENVEIGVGLFSIIGAIGKWHGQATLPADQTLQSMTTPAQWARLVALRDRGILKPGFERTHPYHLAMSLAGSLRDRRKVAPGVGRYVHRYVDAHKDKLIPITKVGLHDATASFFASPPRDHVACLMDAVAMVEAGEAGLAARMRARDLRSQAWAERRVPDALEARPDDGQRSCWPNGTAAARARDASIELAVRNLLTMPQVTLAVVSLDLLARPGGILDGFVAAGFDVRGPPWKR